MPRTEIVPRRSEGGAVPEQQRAAAASAVAPARASHPNAPAPLGAGASGPSGVTIKLEKAEEEEGSRRDGTAPGPAQVAAFGPHAALNAVPSPGTDHDAPAAGRTGGSAGTLVKEEEEEETLGQLRDRQALALAHGPVRVDSHIKVEDSMSGDDTGGDREGPEEEGPGGEGGEGPGEEGGLVLLAGAAHVPGDAGERGGAPRRSTPADRAARAKRGRGDVATGDDVPDAPAPKRQTGGAQAGKSGRHGVYKLTGRYIKKDTPWLEWRVELHLPGNTILQLGVFATTDDAARADDAEVRRRGWAHVKPLNFPQPEELEAYPQGGERCDERGLPLSLALELPTTAQGAAAAQGASGQRPPKLSARKPGKSGFFGVNKNDSKNKATPWRADMHVSGTKGNYLVGYFATKEEAARAYDAGMRRRGWTLVKRLNFPTPADDAAVPPSSAAAGAAGPN